MKATIPPIVRVSWWDPHSVDSWTDLDDLEVATELKLCETVGFLVLDKPNRIGVANTVGLAEQDAGCVIVIPRAMIADTIKFLSHAEEVEV